MFSFDDIKVGGAAGANVLLAMFKFDVEATLKLAQLGVALITIFYIGLKCYHALRTKTPPASD